MPKKILYLKRKNLGLCVGCGTKANPGKIYCEKCRIKHLENDRKRELKKIKNGLCKTCGAIRECKERTTCNACRKKQTKYMEQRRIEFVKNKKCYDCGLDTSNKRCITCYLKIISSNIFRTEKRYKELQELFDKQNGLCNYTGRQLILQENCELDHIMPKAKGGSNSMDNLQWLHRDINKMKHDLTEDIFFASIKEISNHTLLESRIQTV